jgi:hypothetical protein
VRKKENAEMLFSQRNGITPVKSVLQTDSMDDDLRNGLWNVLFSFYWRYSEEWESGNIDTIFKSLWHSYFKWPLDTLLDKRLKTIREYFFNSEWYEVYDFIEFVAQNYPDKRKEGNKNFMGACNSILERELSAYRFVGGRITQITSEEEISEIEEALRIPEPLRNVRTHLKTALDLLADRKSPDYRNSIKESISAVEAISELIAKNPKATLGQALKEIGKKVSLHPALKSAFSSLYGYTSNADGIRHALLDESNLTYEDAKFMLVSCSAFVNYLNAKASQAGIKL